MVESAQNSGLAHGTADSKAGRVARGPARGTMAARILVVDDQKKLVAAVQAYLEREGYQVAVAYDGEVALEEFRHNRPDLIVLDLMLPKVDGLSVCRTVRAESDVPIIMLTARVEEIDRLIGLELGADDYITKPFWTRELVARVKAVLRRSAKAGVQTPADTGRPLRRPRDEFSAGPLAVSVPRHEVTLDGRVVPLTHTEFSLLALLVGHPGRVFTRSQLVEHLHGSAFEAYERTIDMHIANLRKRIEPDRRRPVYIRTVIGVGYKFELRDG